MSGKYSRQHIIDAQRERWAELLPIGHKIERLTVVGGPHFLRRPCKGRTDKVRWYVQVRCECGITAEMLCQNVLKAITCGCVRGDPTTHDGSRTPLYKLWQGMIARCYQPKRPHYRHYGGRGISVCDAWRFNFAAFRDWMQANGWERGLEIDRKDNDGNYEPDNCRVVTHKLNNRNKRDNHILTAFGESKCIADWAEDPRCVVRRVTLDGRIRYGWGHERAITTPLQPGGRHTGTHKT